MSKILKSELDNYDNPYVCHNCYWWCGFKIDPRGENEQCQNPDSDHYGQVVAGYHPLCDVMHDVKAIPMAMTVGNLSDTLQAMNDNAEATGIPAATTALEWIAQAWRNAGYQVVIDGERVIVTRGEGHND